MAIKVHDFEKALSFYTEGLGLRTKITWGEGDGRAAMVDVGDGNYLEIFAGGHVDTASEARMIHFALRTEDCNASHARALAAGAVERMAPKSLDISSNLGPVPVRISFVLAPTGEVIEFFENDRT